MITEERANAADVTACPQFDWCEGHDPHGKDDGAHRTTITIGHYEDGYPKDVTICRLLPTPDFDDPASWEFSMPGGDDWVFGPEEINQEIDEAVKELERARTALLTFMSTQARSA